MVIAYAISWEFMGFLGLRLQPCFNELYGGGLGLYDIYGI